MANTRTTRSRSHDLHGNAPDSCPVALLLVDVINDFAFSEGAELSRHALRAARQIAALKARACAAGVPCIYVNDNFGRWRSNFAAVVEHCGRPGSAGARVVALLRPRADDYFVLKPKHSGFYQTCLSLLLEHLESRVLIVSGFSTESCVAFTAADAYLRDYTLVIPRDATASSATAARRSALAHLSASLKAHTPLVEQIAFKRQGRRAQLTIAGRNLV